MSQSESYLQRVTSQLIEQLSQLVGSKENQSKLKTHLIDPLVVYFKQKLKLFYIIITILLILIIILILYLSYQIIDLKSLLFDMVKSGSIKLPE